MNTGMSSPDAVQTTKEEHDTTTITLEQTPGFIPIASPDPLAAGEAPAGTDDAPHAAPSAEGTKRPECFRYDPQHGVLWNMIRGVALATLDYPDIPKADMANALEKCRKNLVATAGEQPVPKCRYTGGQLAIFEQVMAICEGCMAANRDADGAVTANGFPPLSARTLARTLGKAWGGIVTVCWKSHPLSYPRCLQQRFLPGYSPDWNPSPKDEVKQEEAPMPRPPRPRARSVRRSRPAAEWFEGDLSSYSPPDYLAAHFNLAAPTVATNYRVDPNDGKIEALMQRDGEYKARFRPVRWTSESDLYNGKCYGSYVRRHPIHRRCLVPLDGFFVVGEEPLKWYYIRPTLEKSVFALAAILDPQYKGGPSNHPVILMTIPAPPTMPRIRCGRIPMALPVSAWKRWIEPGKLTKEEVEEMARSCERVKMELRPVGSTRYARDDVRHILSVEEIQARGLEVNPPLYVGEWPRRR